MDTSTIAAAAAAAMAGITTAMQARAKPGELSTTQQEQINLLVSAMQHFQGVFSGVTPDEVNKTIKAVERMVETIEREDRDAPGQKLVWRSAVDGKSLRQLADNVEQQTRIMKSLADTMQMINDRLQFLEVFVKTKSGS